MSDLMKLQLVAMTATRNLGFEQGVKTERNRVFSLSVNEFLVEKLNHNNENTVICLNDKKLVDEQEMRLMDWVDLKEPKA